MNGWLSSEALRIHVVEAAENIVAKEAAKREQLRDREDCADADWSAALRIWLKYSGSYPSRALIKLSTTCLPRALVKISAMLLTVLTQ